MSSRLSKLRMFIAAVTSGITGAMAPVSAMAADSNTTPSGKAQQHYPLGSMPSFHGPENLFTGDVDVQVLFPNTKDTPFSGAYVTFQPGARTAWHTHPAGQHMIVTKGEALTGTRDGRVVSFTEGETVWCPPDIDHWHGATPHRAMTHLVITGDKDGENVTWKEHVTDEQYAKGVNSTAAAMPMLTALSPLQQSLVPVAAFAASGELPALKNAFAEALDNGATVNELKESMIHLYAYLGFPRALNGLGTLMAVVEERKAAGKKDTLGEAGVTLDEGTDTETLGTRVQTELAGKPVAGPLFDFAPAANTFLQRHLFGDLFGRGVLDNETREIVTVAALANLDGATPQLNAHIGMATNAGVSRAQLEETATSLSLNVSSHSGSAVTEAMANVLSAGKKN